MMISFFIIVSTNKDATITGSFLKSLDPRGGNNIFLLLFIAAILNTDSIISRNIGIYF